MHVALQMTPLAYCIVVITVIWIHNFILVHYCFSAFTLFKCGHTMTHIIGKNKQQMETFSIDLLKHKEN